MNVDYSYGSFDESFNGNFSQHAIGIVGEYAFLGNVINEKGCVSAGLQLGFGFGNDTYTYHIDGGIASYDVDLFRFRLATRGTLHYAFIPQLDTYAGVTFLFVDVDKAELTFSGQTDKDTRFIAPTLFAGARYMFTKNFGSNVELSWDRFAYVAVGLSFKF